MMGQAPSAGSVPHRCIAGSPSRIIAKHEVQLAGCTRVACDVLCRSADGHRHDSRPRHRSLGRGGSACQRRGRQSGDRLHAIRGERWRRELPPHVPAARRLSGRGAQSQDSSARFREGIEVRADERVRLDFALRVGEATQTVEVKAGAPLVETSDATVGDVIDSQRIVDLPLNKRNFVDLVQLTAGVTPAARPITAAKPPSITSAAASSSAPTGSAPPPTISFSTAWTTTPTCSMPAAS